MSPSAGALEFSTTASYLRQYKVAGLLGSPTLNYAGSAGFGGVGGGISHPEWKINTRITYSNDDFSLSLLWRHISAMVHSDVVANPASATPGVDRKSVVEGKGVSLRVGFGGRRNIKKKKENKTK